MDARSDFYYHGMKLSLDMNETEYYNATITLDSLIHNIKQSIGEELPQNYSITTFSQLPDGDRFLIINLEGDQWHTGIYSRHPGEFTYCPVETFQDDMSLLRQNSLCNSILRTYTAIESGLAPEKISSLSNELQKKWNDYIRNIPQELNFDYIEDPSNFQPGRDSVSMEQDYDELESDEFDLEEAI